MDIFHTILCRDFVLIEWQKSKVENYFPEVEVEEDIITAINLNVLIEQKPWQRFKTWYHRQ